MNLVKIVSTLPSQISRPSLFWRVAVALGLGAMFLKAYFSPPTVIGEIPLFLIFLAIYFLATTQSLGLMLGAVNLIFFAAVMNLFLAPTETVLFALAVFLESAFLLMSVALHRCWQKMRRLHPEITLNSLKF